VDVAHPVPENVGESNQNGYHRQKCFGGKNKSLSKNAHARMQFLTREAKFTTLVALVL
jgi:hypothetical protein